MKKSLQILIREGEQRAGGTGGRAACADRTLPVVEQRGAGVGERVMGDGIADCLTADDSRTLMHSSVLILQDSELVDLAELFEQGLQVALVQVARNLTDEQLDGVLILL